jgi:hypothetical protein
MRVAVAILQQAWLSAIASGCQRLRLACARTAISVAKSRAFHFWDFALQILLPLWGWVQVSSRDAIMWLGASTLLCGGGGRCGREDEMKFNEQNHVFSIFGILHCMFCCHCRGGPGGIEGCHHVVGGNNFALWGAAGDVDGKLKFN